MITVSLEGVPIKGSSVSKKPLKNTYSFPLYILSWKIIGIFFQPEKPIMLTITRLVVTKIPITMIFIYPHPFIKEIDYDY